MRHGMATSWLWNPLTVGFALAACVLAACALASCAPSGDTASEGPLYTGTTAAPRETIATRAGVRLPSLRPPVSFETLSRELPIETINLRADGVFISRTLLRDAEKHFDIGRWRVSDDGDRLLLSGGTEATRLYAIESPTSLLPLDGDGRQHESAAERRLGRSDLYDPIHDTMRLVGTARSMADAAVFTECSSQWRLSIAMERDYPSFESAYLEHRPEPGGPLLVSLRGHIEERPSTEGMGTTEVLVVEDFERVWPGQTCPTAAEFHAPLRNTHWQLVDVLGRKAGAPPGGRDPFVRLDADLRRASGSLGCREFSCSYEQEESFLRFQGLAKSPGPCEGGNELESVFEEALRTCTSYRIEGQTLYLYGEEEVSARFIAMQPN